MWDGHGDGRERHLAPPLAARPPLGEKGNLVPNQVFHAGCILNLFEMKETLHLLILVPGHSKDASPSRVFVSSSFTCVFLV